MPIEHIHSYLVHVGKGREAAPQIGGTEVPLEHKLFKMLDDIYSKADDECDIDISFNHDADGNQQNPCRDLLINYLNEPTIEKGRRIAERLETVTTNRSGLALLFLITGTEGLHTKIVISRFPADSAILAEENRQTLTVEFLERVFMKSKTAYKAAMYKDTSLLNGFWKGQTVDKQINDPHVQLSKYWVFDFLDSDFLTTSAAGTRQLAVALRNAARNSRNIRVKSEITAAVTLAGSLVGRTLSIRDFGNQFGLSEEAKQAIFKEIKIPRLVDEAFQFHATEFSNQVAYRSVELDSGGTLTAETAEFDNVFQREEIDGVEPKIRFSTVGKVISESLGKSR